MRLNEFGYFVIICRCEISRVTNSKTKAMEEITYLDIVDLDESVGNKLVTESGKDSKQFWKCPHHIVEKVIKIIDEQINIQKYQEEPKALQKAKNDIKSLEIQQEKIINLITDLKNELTVSHNLRLRTQFN